MTNICKHASDPAGHGDAVVVVRRAGPVGLLVVGVHAGLVGRLQRVEAVGVLARVLPIGARQAENEVSDLLDLRRPL